MYIRIDLYNIYSSRAPELPCVVHRRRRKVFSVVRNVSAHDAPLVPLIPEGGSKG